MRRSRHKLLVAVLALAGIAAVVLATTFALLSRLPRFGPGFDPLAPSGLAQLEQAADNGRHLARVLAVYRTQHGRLPDNLERMLDGVDSDPPFRISEIWRLDSQRPPQ